MEPLPGSLKNNISEVDSLSLKSLAHLGDAVYEVYIRQKLVFYTTKIDKLHDLTTSMVRAQFHVELLEHLKPVLTEKEEEIVRRGRNLSLTSSKRRDQSIHRLSTAFEALIGYLYLTDQKRLKEIFSHIDNYIAEKLSEKT
jgi:ribonuclease-3 family protein